MKSLKFLAVLSIFLVFASCKDEIKNDVPVSMAVQLLTPVDENSVELSAMPGGSVLFSWEATIGGDATYTVVFDRTDGNFSNPVQTIISEDNGKKTRVSISRTKMDEIAGLTGIAVEGTGTFKWTVRAQTGSESIKAESDRTISVTRLKEGESEIVVTGVYLTGAATEAGIDIDNALMMHPVGDGGYEYEIYTRLTAGASYHFVYKTLDGSHTFYTESGQLREGAQASTIGTTGIYRVYLNFNDLTCTYTEIFSVNFYINGGAVSVPLEYSSFGVWEVKDQVAATGLSSTDNTNRNYKFRMESSEGDTEWQAATVSGVAPNGFPSYYFMKQVSGFSADGDMWWNVNTSTSTSASYQWNNQRYDIAFMPPHTHKLLHKPNYAYGPDDVDWAMAAEVCNAAFIEHFWNPTLKYFNATNLLDHMGGNYWPQGHALDLLVDAYLRAGVYKDYMDMWCEGVKAGNGGKWANDFIDDMEWIGIAAMRAYTATHDEKFLAVARDVWDGTTDVEPWKLGSLTPHPLNGMPTSAPNNGYYGIKRGWIDDNLGGIAWKSDQLHTRNACSNSPAAIQAGLMYLEFGDEEDLYWLNKIYDWMKLRLFKPATGNVSDAINWRNAANYLATNTLTADIILSGTGQTCSESTGTLTYNQGTFVGMCVQLYKITGDTKYLADAVLAADQVLNTKCTNNVISSETSSTGDNAMFKGIFIRWFTQLIMCEDLSEAHRERYIAWLINNGGSIWNVARSEQNLLSGNWRSFPPYEVGFQAQMSGCKVFEALAMLKEKGYF